MIRKHHAWDYYHTSDASSSIIIVVASLVVLAMRCEGKKKKMEKSIKERKENLSYR